MSNIFDIQQRHLQLLERLEDIIADTNFEDADLQDVAAETIKALEINEQEAKDKIKAYYYFIKMKEGEINLIDDEVKRLKEKKESKEKLIDRLKGYVDQALRMFGERGDKGNYKLKLDNLSVWNVFHKPVILDDNFFRKEYGLFTIKQKFDAEHIDKVTKILEESGIELEEVLYEVNKTKVKNDLNDGVEIPGARIDKDASYVRFK